MAGHRRASAADPFDEAPRLRLRLGTIVTPTAIAMKNAKPTNVSTTAIGLSPSAATPTSRAPRYPKAPSNSTASMSSAPTTRPTAAR